MPDLIMKIGIMLFMVGSLGGVGLRVSPCEVLRPLKHTWISGAVSTNNPMRLDWD